jgi:hypothetical protein
MKSLTDCTDEEIDKITHRNAMRAFHYDPFRHIPRDQATVGALRTKAAGRDVSIVSKGKPAARGTGAVDLGRKATKNAPT